MGRGLPAAWSALFSVPFFLVAAYVYAGGTGYPTILAVPFAAFGVFIIAIGAFVQVVKPSEPRLQDGEEILEKRQPTQRVATVKIVIGLPLFISTVYLLFFTRLPYVYPTLTLFSGLYYFSSGLYTYWTNSLTQYYITTNRVIKEYRFLSLIRQEVPLSKVRGVQERKSITETLVGLGNVRVASGGGGSLEVVMSNMENSERFADTVRELI